MSGALPVQTSQAPERLIALLQPASLLVASVTSVRSKRSALAFGSSVGALFLEVLGQSFIDPDRKELDERNDHCDSLSASKIGFPIF